MHYCPTLNGRFYIETEPLWGHFTRTPQKSWYRQPFQPKHSINHWRDIEGARLPVIKRKDLNFDNWFRTRIREEACLPLYYTVGYRFIRITRAFPAGFKCAEQPLTLAEVRDVRAYHKKLEKDRINYEKALAAKMAAARKNKRNRK